MGESHLTRCRPRWLFLLGVLESFALLSIPPLCCALVVAGTRGLCPSGHLVSAALLYVLLIVVLDMLTECACCWCDVPHTLPWIHNHEKRK